MKTATACLAALFPLAIFASVETTYGPHAVVTFTNTAARESFTLATATEVEILAVGGGGAGGYTRGGGGGGGGVIETTLSLEAGTYYVEIGAGGAATSSTSKYGDGGATTLYASDGSTVLVRALGGGGGGSYVSGTYNGHAGGCGGGAGAGSSSAGGTGTDGQGFAGGASKSTSYAAGGGGAGEAGGSPIYGTAGNHQLAAWGGDGRWSSITGTRVCYGGGGAGNSYNKSGIIEGGRGGGAAARKGGVGYPGTDGLGGGGSGGYKTSGGRGGSGVLIIRRRVQEGLAAPVNAAAVSALPDGVTISYDYFGGATSAAFRFADRSSVPITLPASAGTASFELHGLRPATAYSGSIVLSNVTEEAVGAPLLFTTGSDDPATSVGLAVASARHFPTNLPGCIAFPDAAYTGVALAPERAVATDGFWSNNAYSYKGYMRFEEGRTYVFLRDVYQKVEMSVWSLDGQSLSKVIPSGTRSRVFFPGSGKTVEKGGWYRIRIDTAMIDANDSGPKSADLPLGICYSCDTNATYGSEGLLPLVDPGDGSLFRRTEQPQDGFVADILSVERIQSDYKATLMLAPKEEEFTVTAYAITDYSSRIGDWCSVKAGKAVAVKGGNAFTFTLPEGVKYLRFGLECSSGSFMTPSKYLADYPEKTDFTPVVSSVSCSSIDYTNAVLSAVVAKSFAADGLMTLRARAVPLDDAGAECAEGVVEADLGARTVETSVPVNWTMTGLAGGTRYRFYLGATDTRSGTSFTGSAFTEERTWTMDGTIRYSESVAVVSTSADSVTFAGTIDNLGYCASVASAVVFYGDSKKALTNVFDATSFITGEGGFSVVLSGLSPFKRWYFQLSVTNDLGGTAVFETSSALTSSAKITEIMASNETGAKTAAGGTGLDWIEIYNDSNVAVDLAGWYLFDDPTKAKKKWEKIQGNCVIPANAYKIVWCDKDYEGFTADEAYSRIGLSSSGETAFIADPDGNIVHQVVFGQMFDDTSVGFGRVSHVLMRGDPVGMTADAEAMGDDGFETVTWRFNKTVSTLDNVETYIADRARWSTTPVTNTVKTLAFQNTGSQTNFTWSPFPGLNKGTSYNNFALTVKGSVLVPRSGLWTFAVGSDDGFSAKLSRLGTDWGWETDGTRGYEHTMATFNLDAGIYEVELVYFNYNSNSVLDFSCYEGATEDWNNTDFKLVGSEASGVVHAGALGSLIAEDISNEMLGKKTEHVWSGTFVLNENPLADETAASDRYILSLRYADGFSATINGRVFASAAVDGARALKDILTPVPYQIPNAWLVQGTNTLEITVMNDALDDTELFLEPVVYRSREDANLLYFTAPTPGEANGDAGRTGLSPEVTANEPHGYKTQPFDLVLSCPSQPEATIRYTTDGSSPTETSPAYTAPIPIARTTVVRAAVVDSDSILQRDSSFSYLFVVDIVRAEVGVTPENFPTNGSSAANGQSFVYGMRTAIVDGDAETQSRLYRGFTNSIQTLSIVIDPKNMFDKKTGIYVNASGNGRTWERQTMVELIDPVNGSAKEFSVPAGIRIRGAYSRGGGVPKHSLRFIFRAEYGMSKLNFPLFDDEGADVFKRVDLRTSQNYAWSNGNNNFTLIEDVFARDTQRDMGDPYHRSRYYNLYINGVYWGLYQTEERMSQNYAETYGGGDGEDYDIVRTSSPGYNTGVKEGDATAWNAFWDITTNQGYSGDYSNNYNRVRGLDPDGTVNPDYPVYLNETNLADLVIGAHYAADADSPANSGGMANNLAAFRYRGTENVEYAGFIWNRHDAEHSLATGSGYSSDTCKYGTREQGKTALGNFNPNFIHMELCAHPEYRMMFADRVYRHCFRPGGALTVEKAQARWNARMAELDDAVVCEAARWGRNNQTRQTWINACNNNLNFMSKRLPYLKTVYQNRGWYPSIDAPGVVTNGVRLLGGEELAANAKIAFTGGGETTVVYYTLDGSDPRLVGGGVSPAATAYAGKGIALPALGAAVRARILKNGSEWSPIECVDLFPAVDVTTALEVTEVNAFAETPWFEIHNRSTAPVPLKGWKYLTTEPPKEIPTKKWKNWVSLASYGTLPADGYLVVEQSGNADLLSTGCAVCLAYGDYDNESKRTAEEICARLDFPEQLSGCSYGVNALGEDSFFLNPTPAAVNDDASIVVPFYDEGGHPVLEKPVSEQLEEMGFAADSPIMGVVTTKTELAAVNAFIAGLGIVNPAAELSPGERAYFLHSYVLAPYLDEGHLFEEEPTFVVEDFVPDKENPGTWTMTVSIKDGADAVAIAKESLREKISKSTDLTGEWTDLTTDDVTAQFGADDKVILSVEPKFGDSPCGFMMLKLE